MSATSAIQLSDDTFEQEVLKFPGLVLVDFWAPWCPPCRAMTPDIEKLAVSYADSPKVKITQIDVDQSPKTQEKYNILSLPTIITFLNGEPVDTNIGYTPLKGLEEFIQVGLKQVEKS
jgi:thioredoxin 1